MSQTEVKPSQVKSNKKSFKFGGHIAVLFLGIMLGAFINHNYEANKKCQLDQEELTKFREERNTKKEQVAKLKEAVGRSGRYGGVSEAGKLKFIRMMAEQVDGVYTGREVEDVIEISLSEELKVTNLSGQEIELSEVPLNSYVLIRMSTGEEGAPDKVLSVEVEQ